MCSSDPHDPLIEAGIIPKFCILLDPRAHVQDFIEDPHPKVTYLIASMCHPSTLDRLMEKGAVHYGYHAQVGADELDAIKMRLGGKHFLLGGGCSAAMRGISVMHCLGFRRFKLYGYDLCYFSEEGLDMDKKSADGEPHYFDVEVFGKKFLTDAEKVAQCQDFNKIQELSKEVSVEVFGPGMVPHVWNHTRKILPEFKDVFGG